MKNNLTGIDAALTRAGGVITSVVGTMWCALAFALVALVSLPAALHTGDVVVIVAWVAQTFLQLVLLAVIMVGQSIESARTEARDRETHDTVMAEAAETQEIVAGVHAMVAEIHGLVTAAVKA
jgi:hypothetical protein